MKVAGTAWWSIYVLLLVGLGAARLVERVARDSGGFASRFGPLIAVIVVSIGIIAWLQGRRLMYRWFWCAMFGLIVIVQLSSLLYGSFLLLSANTGPAGIVGGVALVLVPAAYALFQYGYRSTGIWE